MRGPMEDLVGCDGEKGSGFHGDSACQIKKNYARRPIPKSPGVFNATRGFVANGAY